MEFTVELPTRSSEVDSWTLDPTFAEVDANRVEVFTWPVTFTAAVLTKVLLADVDPTERVEVLTVVVPIVKLIGFIVAVFVELASLIVAELAMAFATEFPMNS